MNEATKRSARPVADTWRLEDIFASDQAWEDTCRALEEGIGQIEGYRGRLAVRDALLALLRLLDELSLNGEKLYCYARMRRDEDNALARYQALTDRAQAMLVRLSTAGSFVAPELLSLPSGTLEALSKDRDFSDYSMMLIDLERRRPHTLSAEEERIVAMAGELCEAPSTAFDMLTDADMVFPEITDDSGKTFRLTQASFVPTMMSRDRRVRREAFQKFYGTFGQYSATIPSLYAASVKADQFGARSGKFASSLEAGLFPDNVPLTVYENLIAETRRHIPMLSKYMNRNARLIGVDKMAMYDVYVPTTEDFKLNLKFEDAFALVVDCLAPLGEDYQDGLRRALKERWVDPYENEGKSAGAYSWGVYDSHPFVLLNYHENLDGLLTIAHEMGHAMHSFYSNAAQPKAKAEYSLFVAEVASTVNEVLVLTELLNRYPAREAQAYLLNNLLDAYRTTLFRQTMFAEFEKESHALAERGQALTSESLNALYADLNAAYYPEIEQTDEIKMEWMRIPHFYRAFYVYKYATGFSAATALAAMIRDQGAPAVARYKRFLSAGGSLYPIEGLRLAGVDMESPEPVERALKLFQTLLDRYLEVTE